MDEKRPMFEVGQLVTVKSFGDLPWKRGRNTQFYGIPDEDVKSAYGKIFEIIEISKSFDQQTANFDYCMRDPQEGISVQYRWAETMLVPYEEEVIEGKIEDESLESLLWG